MICPHCNSTISDSSSFCGECGKKIERYYPADYQEKTIKGNPEDQYPDLRVRYADLGSRFLAFLIDVAILYIFASLNYLFFYDLLYIGLYGGSLAQTTSVVNILFFTGYFVIMESSNNQGTVGKIILKLRKVDIKGNRLKLKEIIIHNLWIVFFALWFVKPEIEYYPIQYSTGRFLTSIPIVISWLMILFSTKKQGLHDLLFKVTVVKRK